MSPRPDCLCHYYAADRGPFRSLTRMAPGAGERLLDAIRQEGRAFASRRADDYLEIRRQLEARVRAKFIAKGGRPRLDSPHYMILGTCPWVKGWYVDGRELCLPLADFPSDIVSFTYGDTFPAMRFQDGKPTRGQVYRLEELPELIETYGLPQQVNPDGALGPDRYIEAQVWDDAALRAYL